MSTVFDGRCFIVKVIPMHDEEHALQIGPFCLRTYAERWKNEFNAITDHRNRVFAASATGEYIILDILIEELGFADHHHFDINVDEEEVVILSQIANDPWAFFEKKYPDLNLKPVTAQ